MDFHSTLCIFLGYSPSHHGYRCFDLSTECIYVARHVWFNETSYPFCKSTTHELHHGDQQQQPISDPYVSSYPNPIPLSDQSPPNLTIPVSSTNIPPPLTIPMSVSPNTKQPRPPLHKHNLNPPSPPLISYVKTGPLSNGYKCQSSHR